MTIAQITPEETKRLLDAGNVLYLDVRTVPEFVGGHPPSALNIPVAEINAHSGQMEFNERFIGLAMAHIPRETRLVVGCRTGGRSQTACEMLAEAGYRNLSNVVGGFAGITDAHGQIEQEGWSTLGYPIERGEGGSKSYACLLAKSS